MFWNNFYFLCQQVRKKPLTVVKDIGIAHGNITKWKNGSIPRGDTLQKLADYFGVSVDYLLGKDTRRDEPPVRLYREQGQISMVPLFESVSAGFGALAVNEIVDYVPVAPRHDAAELLCIRVRGDSMYPTIEDGDIILVHKQDTVDSGTVAVVLVDGEDGLVKRVAYGDGWIELQSVNPMYMPRRFNGRDAARVKVMGRVEMVMKML